MDSVVYQCATLRRDISVSMLDSVHRHDLVSWPSTRSQAPTSYTQYIPRDVRSSHTFDDHSDCRPRLTDIFDPTTLSVDFDRSCLDGLDDQLLYHPMDALAGMFWEDSVESSSSLTPAPTLLHNTGHDRHPVSIGSSSDDSDSDLDECMTYDDDYASLPVMDISADFAEMHPVGDLSAVQSRNIYFDPPFDHGEKSYMFNEPHFTLSDPTKSVHYFPIPSQNQLQSQNQKRKASGITSLRAYFPGRFTKAVTLT